MSFSHQVRLVSASSFYACLLQVIDGVCPCFCALKKCFSSSSTFEIFPNDSECISVTRTRLYVYDASKIEAHCENFTNFGSSKLEVAYMLLMVMIVMMKIMICIEWVLFGFFGFFFIIQGSIV